LEIRRKAKEESIRLQNLSPKSKKALQQKKEDEKTEWFSHMSTSEQIRRLKQAAAWKVYIADPCKKNHDMYVALKYALGKERREDRDNYSATRAA